MFLWAKLKDEVNWQIKPENKFRRLASDTIFESDNTKPEVVLTFDDGPNPNNTPIVLSVLKSRNVKAIFFLIGENARKYPKLVKQIIADGHEIGYHSMEHSWMLLDNQEKLQNDFEEFIKVVGVRPRYTRPPFGVVNSKWKKFTINNNLETVLTNAFPRDKTIRSSQILLERLKKITKNGSIILLHDGDDIRSDRKLPVMLTVLPQYLDYLENSNFKIVSLKKSRSI